MHRHWLKNGLDKGNVAKMPRKRKELPGKCKDMPSIDMDLYNRETAIQMAVVEYCRLRGILFYKVHNEGKRTAWQGKYLVRLGLRRGIPDLCIPEPRKGYHGLYIELKTVGRGKLTVDQAIWLKVLNERGYLAVEARGLNAALAVINDYFDIK